MVVGVGDYFVGLPSFLEGWVWLTGAGPGDRGLLTLHALHGLREADVIIYDALVGDSLLEFASSGAELIFAGKRGGKRSPQQVDITDRLIASARRGLRVLRLKGGDPFVFGRGGEEALALVRAGIPFRIIPGITAGIGGLAYAGIPLTHRDVNSSVTFITGHSISGLVPDSLDWSSLSRGASVLVFYMALRHVDEIAARLLSCGRSASESVAVISCATTENQDVRVGILGDLVSLADTASAPAVIVVGAVVDFRKFFDWFGL